MSIDVLVNRGDLGSSGGLLNKDAPVTGVCPWSTYGPWSRGDLGRCGGPVEEDAPGIEDVQQIGAVHRTGSDLHTGKHR